jgi:cyclohexanecarboxyl-CoA dehydrogenase
MCSDRRRQAGKLVAVDFAFSPEQEALRATVRRFAEQVVAPRSREIDRTSSIPDDIAKGLGELGLLGMNLGEESGGPGASSVDMGVVVEELARADFVVAHLPIHHGLGVHVVAQASEAVRDRWLPSIQDGSERFAFALTEPEAGSDAGAITCRATPTPSGYLLSGEKTSISFLGPARAAVVVAKTPNPRGRGITAFYVPLDLPGVTTGLFEDLGCRGLTRGWLNLADVEVPADNRIGAEGDGFRLVMGIFDLTRTLIALAAVGAAEASLDAAVVYARTRKTFGVPIGAHQGVSFELAEHATRLQAARWTCYRALWLRDAGRPHTADAAMAKWWGVTTARDAIHAAMLVHGHAAYTRELPLEQRLRDVMGMEWGDGTANAAKLVIAREMIGRDVVDARPGA